MNQTEAIDLAKANKYKVLEVEIDGKDFFIVDVDPIDMGRGHEWNNKTTICTSLENLYGDTDKKSIKVSRLQDMQDDCMKFYGKNSESYKKIIWPIL